MEGRTICGATLHTCSTAIHSVLRQAAMATHPTTLAFPRFPLSYELGHAHPQAQADRCGQPTLPMSSYILTSSLSPLLRGHSRGGTISSMTGQADQPPATARRQDPSQSYHVVAPHRKSSQILASGHSWYCWQLLLAAHTVLCNCQLLWSLQMLAMPDCCSRKLQEKSECMPCLEHRYVS